MAPAGPGNRLVRLLRRVASLLRPRRRALFLSWLVTVFLLLRRLGQPLSFLEDDSFRPVRGRIPPLGRGRGARANSAPGVTGAGAASAVGEVLRGTGEAVDAGAAVEALEGRCGWLSDGSNFEDEKCLESAGFDGARAPTFADPALIDVVTATARNLDWLESWREFFQGFHVIIVQYGDQAKHVEIPEWVDYELYNREDIERALGRDSWIISPEDATIRSFGFLVSTKPYVYSIDDDCLLARDNNGDIVNPIAVHLQNLRSNSHPYFFNTLYDPVSTGSDFVRGYPYSLRGGVPTAISHGLWLSVPDYDAPTQLLKPSERNANLLDMSLTVPRGTLYPMCSANVAFSRELIGPALMQGLAGEGRPWARHDDMFAGWASKVVADHLGVGVKTGRPYVRRDKPSNPFTSLEEEYEGLDWQEDMVRFFADEVRFSKRADTPAKAYAELAGQIGKRFRHVNPYFARLSDSMTAWTKVWDGVAGGEIQPVPSRASDPSVPRKYAPLNLSTKSSGGGYLSEDDVIRLFPVLGKDRHLSVTARDVAMGHRWKTYILPIDGKWSEGTFHGWLATHAWLDCYTKSCDSKTVVRGGRGFTDHSAEIVILRKLLASLHFVKDIGDADLVLVPILGATAIKVAGCPDEGKCMEAKFRQLSADVERMSDETKRHLYLSTHDYRENAKFFRMRHARGHAVVTLGPGDLVVPTLNPEASLQPSNWTGCTPLEGRAHFLLANLGRRAWLKDREVIVAQLLAYNGTKSVVVHDPGGSRDLMSDSAMTACAPGDLPFQKRFFDAILRCSVPVVVAREVEGVGKAYWSNVDYKGRTPSGVGESYPELGFSYDELVVEVDGAVVEGWGLMEHLEKIPWDVLESKRKRIDEVRNRFLYDLSGSAPDAFSAMLETLWRTFL